MNLLKLIYGTVVQLVRQIGQFPKTIADAVRHRQQQQTILDELEVERLDRIRNPSKYRGK